MIIANASFQSTIGTVTIGFSRGSTILVAGPNGVGKSALLYQIYRALPQGTATYIPGHRQINLNSGLEQGGQDADQLLMNTYNNYDAFNRYKGAWSEDLLRSAIRTLMHAESAFNRDFRQSVASDKPGSVSSAALKNSPIDTLNLIFSNSNLPISFTITDRGITAERSGLRYGVDALSDGERASLFLAATIIVQRSNTVLLIDEPEKHLHPSITGVLLETALRSRNDIALVVSSHDVTLIEQLNVDATLYVKGSTVISPRPEQRSYDVELITDGTIPELLKADVLGSRSEILFIEGDERSRDAALYAKIYAGKKIITKGGCDKVIEAVSGIRSSNGLHWLEVFGLIDLDGRSPREINKLEKRGIFTLPTPTIENLFFLAEVQECFVEADRQMKGGHTWEDRKANLAGAIAKAAPIARDEIVARRTCWIAQREISSHPLSVKEVKAGNITNIAISVESIKTTVEKFVDEIIKLGDYQKILTDLPIKNTDIPEVAAKALGATSFKDYCDVVQRQIDIESPFGVRARDAIQAILPTLSSPTNNQTMTPNVMGHRYIGMPGHPAIVPHPIVP